jgi:hypothetical protein
MVIQEVRWIGSDILDSGEYTVFIAEIKTTLLVLVLWYIEIIKELYLVFCQSMRGFVH